MQPNPFRQDLFTGQTASGTAAVIDCRSFNCLTVWIIGTGTLDSGVITIEEALDPGYTGTWSSIATVNATDVTGGKALAYHVAGSGGIFHFDYVRVRISTVIAGAGGSIACAATAN